MTHAQTFFPDHSQASSGRVPTTEELTDFIVGLDTRAKADIVVGKTAVLFDPDMPRLAGTEPFSLARASSLSPQERSNRLDFGELGAVILDRNPAIVDTLADELLTVSMQISPEKVVDMMNRVRIERKQAPVIEPGTVQGTYEGTIIAQCPTQSVMRCQGSNVLLEHDRLDIKPIPNARARVEFRGEMGTVTHLQKAVGTSVAKGEGKDPSKERDQ